MYMRLLNVEIDRDGAGLLRKLYDEKVITALQQVEGCRYAGLMQSVAKPERCISLTLWDSPGHALAYERSGLYGRLLEESKIFFSQPVEYTIKLSEDLQVEYVPVSTGPVARAYPVAAQSGPGKKGRDLSQAVWLRIVSLKILPGKMEQFKQLYVRHSIPVLRAEPGCRHVYLLENDQGNDEVFSITIWDSREQAAAYEQSGKFEKLIDIQKETLSGHAQEKLLGGAADPGRSHGTGDVMVEHYTVLTGRSFS